MLSSFGSLDAVVPELIQREFSLGPMTRMLRKEIRRLRAEIAEAELEGDGHILKFENAQQGMSDRERKEADVRDLRFKLHQTQVRIAIAGALEVRQGPKLTLQKADLPAWEQRFAEHLPDDDMERDAAVTWYQERFVLDTVAEKYIRRITAPRQMTRSRAFLVLLDALETRLGQDGIEMMEHHLAYAILDALLPETDDPEMILHDSATRKGGA